MSRFICAPLASHHDRRNFHCGVPELDDYLQHRASQDIRRRVAAVFVLSPLEQPSRIAGYYTLSAASVLLADLPNDLAKKLPRYPHVPAVLIGRLARDTEYPGTGKLLLINALTRSMRHSVEIAAATILVDAKNDHARRFYAHFGFTALEGNQHRMFLPMKTVARLLGEEGP